MDDELLRWLYHRLLGDPKLKRTRGHSYGDGLVALVYFYAVLSRRSPRWASRRINWPIWCRAVLPVPMISYSQLSRRLRTASLRQVITSLDDQLRGRLLPHCSPSRDKA